MTPRFREAFEGFCIRPVTIAELHGGWTNVSLRVSTADATVIVREHRGLVRSAKAFERKFDIVGRIAALCPLVGAPLRTSTGCRTYQSSGGALYSASPYAEGTTAPHPAATPAALATALAHFHRASASIPPANRTSLLRSYQTMEWLSQRFEVFRHAPRVRHLLDWKRLREIAHRCASALAAVPAGQLPALWVHGDVSAENIVVRGKRVARFIDFDFLHYSERVYDVATLVDSLAWKSPGSPRAAAIAGEILEAYGAILKLSNTERGRLDLFRLRRNLAMIWYVATRHRSLAGRALLNCRRLAELSHQLAADALP